MLETTTARACGRDEGVGEASSRRRGATFHLHDLRIAGVVMLVGAFVLRILPWHVGVTCPLRAATGIPCPLCGMTTSVKATSGLRLDEAFAANPAGPIAVLVAVGLLVWRRRDVVRIPTWVLVGGLGAMWVFQLFRYGIL